MPSRLINLTLDNSRFVDRVRAEAEVQRAKDKRKKGVTSAEVVNACLDTIREEWEKEEARVDLDTLLPVDPS